jgi:LAS superfamily LD-carboxypeptidase LdcB
MRDDCLPISSGQNPALRQIDTLPPITGDATADQHIRNLATARGYRAQAILRSKDLLAFPASVHHCAAHAWAQLQAVAKTKGFDLSVLSGYRSPERQQQIFLAKLGDISGKFDQITSGAFDSRLNRILAYSAIPGYSRHHTGFAIDVQERGNGLRGFSQSNAFKWLSSNGYRVARQFGFVPSYPAALTNQGPNPEPWEFLWIGSMAANFVSTPSIDIYQPHGNLLDSARRILHAISVDNGALAPKLVGNDTPFRQHPDHRDIDNLPGG